MPDFPGNSEIITRAIMNRFAKENFRFVTKEIEFSTEPIVEEGSAEDDSNIFSPLSVPAIESFVRVTHEGYKFIAKASTPTRVTSTQPYQGIVQETSSNLRHRDLDVIGPDTRSAIENTSVFPYRTIGAVDYNHPTLCTATMISRRSALTAGHCAYHFSSKSWRPMKKIAPARYIDLTQADKTAEPFGTWDVDYVTVMQAYIDGARRTADVAVITYKPRNGTNETCINSPQVYVSIFCFL
jgi:V8-like Glu-specific endopeptidase